MAQFKKRKLPAPIDAEYPIPPTQSDVRTDAASVAEILPTLITRLKDAGVTTLIMQTNHSVAAAASKVMAQQEWYPEIVVTSTPYEDLDLFAADLRPEGVVARLRHGVVPARTSPATPTRPRPRSSGSGAPTRARGSRSRSTRCSACTPRSSSSARTSPRRRSSAKSLAKIFSQGVAAGGYYSKSAFTVEVKVAAPGEINPRWRCHGLVQPRADRDRATTTSAATRKGKYVYLNEGQRFIFGHLPTAKQKFFDASASSAQFDTPPPSEPKQPHYECVGCPSTGATDIIPAASAA